MNIVQKTVSILFSLAFLVGSSFGEGITSVDKFTGLKTYEDKIYIGHTDNDVLYIGGNNVDLVLKHEQGQPPMGILQASFHGANSNKIRANDIGIYRGGADLLFLIDGKRENVKFITINYINDIKDTVQKPFGGAGTTEQHTQRIDFVFILQQDLLQKLASAKLIEGSIREHLDNTQYVHNFKIKGRKIKQFSEFQQAISNNGIK